MKKKTVTLSVIFALLFVSTVTIASFSSFVSGTETNDAVASVPLSEVSYSSAMAETSSENMSSINSLVSKYKLNNLSYEEYTDIESYITFMIKHTLTSDEIAVINSLVASGTTMQTVENIYDFYLTTNDDFSIISKIAALETAFWGDHWIENAYNHITGNAHGVLNLEDIKEYSNHLSIDDITYANILCRKGVYNIREILDKVQSGESWDNITDEIYSSVHTKSKLSGSALERATYFSKLSSSCFSYSSAPMQTYNFAKTLSKCEADLSTFRITAENIVQDHETIKQKYYDELAQAANAILQKIGLATSYMDFEQYNTYDETNRSIAVANGLHEKHIRLLEQRGYTMEEIANASYSFDGDILDVVALLKAERSGNV